MAFISKSTIQDVNTRLDAVSVTGEYIRLEQKGGRWWGRCPFHGGGQEKTPSFVVDPDKKMFYCFGCSKGGSIISFVMEMDKLTYPQAVKNLAVKMGIEVIYEESRQGEIEQDNTLKTGLYELYKRLTSTFQHFLFESQGKSALSYIKQRGISDEMVKSFNLGYSPVNRDFLYNFLRQKGYSDEFLAKSGLFSSKYKTIPLFSGRLMFPIEDLMGRIVAFGGRALPGETQDNKTPKYINSPESEIYEKRKSLFALNIAKPLMRQSKTAYLAEGYMDVIALHQAGVTNSVAPLGTAFTDDQALSLRRWVDRIIFIFDNDEAGQKAANRAILTCRKNKVACSIADIKTGFKYENDAVDSDNFKDPADILKEFGARILNNVLKFNINDFEYLIFHGKNLYAKDGNINKAVEFMFPYLDALDSEIDKSDYITRIADIFKIERSAVRNEYSKWRQNNFRPSYEKHNDEKKGNISEAGFQADEPLDVRRNIELNLLTNIALNMELYPEFRSVLEIKDFDDRAAKEIFISLEECFLRDEAGIDSLFARIKNEQLKNFIYSRGTSGEFKGDSRKFMEDGIKIIKVKKYKKRLTEINGLMRESERNSKDIDNIDELLAEKIEIDEQIRELEGR